MLGIVCGMTATLWTIVVPILAIIVVVLTLRDGGDDVSTRH
jgi:preprotein translocase subunit SecG